MSLSSVGGSYLPLVEGAVRTAKRNMCSSCVVRRSSSRCEIVRDRADLM